MGMPARRARGRRAGQSALAAAALGCLLLAPAAMAQMARLATTPGDGAVSVDLDAYGAFGYRAYGNGHDGLGDAIYDPVGSVGPSGTSWQSAVYFRLPGQSTFLTVGPVGFGSLSGNLPNPGIALANELYNVRTVLCDGTLPKKGSDPFSGARPGKGV